MTNLGLWAPYINEQEMRRWYNLPDALQTECNRYLPDGHELDAIGDFARLRRSAIAYANQSVAGFKPRYHNAAHFRQTEEHGLAAADAYARGNRQKMPEVVRQALSLALYTHDAHHCASTFRSDAPRGVYRRDLGLHVSSEWVTAYAVNEFMSKYNLVLPARLFQVGIAWASTYGGNTPRGRLLGIPNPQPRTIWGCIMRAADVCPPKDFETWLRMGIAVNYGEIPATKPATDWKGFVAMQLSFVQYIEHCMDRLDATAKSTITNSLGWRKRIRTLRHGLNQLSSGDTRILAIARDELRQCHATLD